MTFKRYSNPEAVGWEGWWKDENGQAVAFRHLDGRVICMSDLGLSDHVVPRSDLVVGD